MWPWLYIYGRTYTECTYLLTRRGVPASRPPAATHPPMARPDRPQGADRSIDGRACGPLTAAGAVRTYLLARAARAGESEGGCCACRRRWCRAPDWAGCNCLHSCSNNVEDQLPKPYLLRNQTSKGVALVPARRTNR